VCVVRTLKTFQGTHILGASRGLLCDSYAVLFLIGCTALLDILVNWRTTSVLLLFIIIIIIIITCIMSVDILYVHAWHTPSLCQSQPEAHTHLLESSGYTI